jgi:hypothetical protein
MAYRDYQYLRVSVGDHICRATIDNPPMNLADLKLFGEVALFAQEVAGDDDVNVAIVDSADPDFFVAHADIAMLQALPTDDTTLHDELSAFHTVVELFRTMPKGDNRGDRGDFPRRRQRVRVVLRHAVLREAMAGPAAAERMTAFMAGGGQTRDYELGETPF